METIQEKKIGKNLSEDNSVFKNLPDVFVILKYMLVLGILFVISLSFFNADGNAKNHYTFLYTIGNAMLIAGAFYGAGGFTGFLFGIPKIIQNNHVVQKGNEGNNGSDVVHNDNLVQISDWLTKIIVGVGLTKLYDIPKYLYRIGEKLGTSILGGEDRDDSFGTNVSVAIILYFSILGFMMVYIWTRIYFVRVLKETDKELKKVLEETVEKKILVENKLKDTINEKKELEEISQITKSELDAIITTFPDVTQNLKDKQIEMKKDTDVEDDPHKGNFGGLSETKGRRLSAKVKETSYDKDLFVIDLEVVSTSVLQPLQDEVVFYLHPSFPIAKETIKVVDGKAENKLISYGAFTVGVVCDNGQTKLELDLSQLEDAPEVFRQR